MKVIVGLGNPGAQYEKTRHNLGFWVIDALAEKWGACFKSSRVKAVEGDAQYGGMKVLLLKPQTFMNLSGEAVSGILRFYKREVSDLVVVYDDLDLELGRLKFSNEGSSGGHRGVESIIGSLGTKVFDRLRVGIGRPAQGDPADYVLKNFSRGEEKLAGKVVSESVSSLEYYIDQGIIAAMNHTNGSIIS